MAGPVIPWVSKTNPVENGEEVRAAIKNRHPNELQQRTDHLYQRLNAVTAGEAIFAFDVALDAAVDVGHAVYWDVGNLQYDRALAAVNYDPVSGGFMVADSSYAVGLCTAKSTSTRGTILLNGLVREFDFTNGAGVTGQDTAHAGAYYLSASTPGTYTRQKPPVGVYIAYLRGDGVAHIQPTPREVLEGHIHFAYELVAAPAGLVECPEPDRVYTFIVSDVNQPGWLPADDPSFGGLAPAGAKFGYNLPQHPELERVFPPVPVNSAYLEADGIGVAGNTFMIDVNGLWWFDDCYGMAPWPTEVRPCDSSSSSSSVSSSSTSVNPLLCESGPILKEMGFHHTAPEVKRLMLYFTKMVVKTNESVVTSLSPEEGSPITVKDCDGNDADTGDLKLNLDLNLSIVEGQAGYQALKGASGQTLTRGPVLEGVKAGSFISIAGATGESELDANGFWKGKAIISALIPGTEQQEAPIELVALNGVREDIISDAYGGIFFLSFPSDKESSLRGRILIPFSGLITSPQLKLRFWLLGRAAGTLPPVSVSVRRLPRPDPSSSCDKVDLPLTDTALSNLPLCSLDSANQYVEVESDSFAVAQGDEVYFTLTRAAPDSYGADMGILRQGTEITE